MSRDYVSGRGSRDVWTSDAALVGGGSETSGLATQIVWGVGAETFAFDAALEGGGTETDCTSDAAYASCLFMLELNFHSGSSIYSSQWFACLASHTSRSNSPVAHPSFFPMQRGSVPALTRDGDLWDSDFSGFQCLLGIGNFKIKSLVNFPVGFPGELPARFLGELPVGFLDELPVDFSIMSRDYVSGRGSRDVWTSDAALVGGGSETSGLATQIVWSVGAETFAFDAALECGGTETDCTSDAAYVYIYPYEEMRGASCLFMLELNFHSGSSIYSSQWFTCLASHTSRSNSPVAHPSFFPLQSSTSPKKINNKD
ncbi:hypothetical protein YC2023_115447 [Brassica napus]